MKEFEKKLELHENYMITYAKDKEGDLEHVDDLSVELNNELWNITAKGEDSLMEKTFNNPSVGFKCDFCSLYCEKWKGFKDTQDKTTLFFWLVLLHQVKMRVIWKSTTSNSKPSPTLGVDFTFPQ